MRAVGQRILSQGKAMLSAMAAHQRNAEPIRKIIRIGAMPAMIVRAVLSESVTYL
jgi:hypothetical protein